jgi:mono/diheme cytochrome c family protein
VKFMVGAVTMLLVIVAVAGFVLATGRFNVAATAPPDFTDKLAPWVLEKSIERRVGEVGDPVSRDPGAVARGTLHYRENCLPCHGAPGVDAAEFQEGMNPSPPGIAADVVQHDSDAELFWVIKNGIRMTGMPAFGVNHKDDEIRDIVAFVRHVPQLTDAEREALKAPPVGEEHHHDAAPPVSPAPAASAAPHRH